MTLAFALLFPLTPLPTVCSRGPTDEPQTLCWASPKSPFFGWAQAPVQTRLRVSFHSRNGSLWEDTQKEGREDSWENKKSQGLARISLTHLGGGWGSLSGRAKPAPLSQGQGRGVLSRGPPGPPPLVVCSSGWASPSLPGCPLPSFTFMSDSLPSPAPRKAFLSSPPPLSSRLHPAGCSPETRLPQGDPKWPLELWMAP